MKDEKLSERLREDGAILYGELLKVSELVKHIFSTEQFDLNKVKLYKKTVDIWEFLCSEIRIFESAFPQVSFDIEVHDAWTKEIDETQLRQVFHNLLTNATKFADKQSPKIYIVTKKKITTKYLYVSKIIEKDLMR